MYIYKNLKKEHPSCVVEHLKLVIKLYGLLQSVESWQETLREAMEKWAKGRGSVKTIYTNANGYMSIYNIYIYMCVCVHLLLHPRLH